MAAYIKLIRVRHWIKNILIFCPLFFGKQLFDYVLLQRNIYGFFSFSLITSSIYIINDICDIDSDKNHPIKCSRPLASGLISINRAKIICCLLICLGIILTYIGCRDGKRTLGVVEWENLQMGGGALKQLIVILSVYFVVNVFYSKVGKHMPILDIVLLSSGFLLRVIYGAVLSDIQISTWLYLVIISGSCYMALGKRRNELRNQEAQSQSRKVLKNYPISFLNQNMYMCITLTIVFYAMWCTDMVSQLSPNLSASVPLILLIAMRYSYNIENILSDGDPVEVIFSDKILWVLITVYIIYVFQILY